jgi:hypothetical protein
MLDSNERTSLLAPCLVVEGATMVWHVELTNKSTECVGEMRVRAPKPKPKPCRSTSTFQFWVM